VKILIVLTYYHPHISGFTLYAQHLAEGLAARGHQVTVLASQHQPELAREEHLNGVRVVRVPVAFRVSKGPIMPLFPVTLWKLAREHDVVNIHLPQFEAGIASPLARLAGRPVTLTYHCDLNMPPGPFNRVIDEVVFAMNYVGGFFANRIVAYTADYAAHSRFLTKFPRKILVIPPPVVIPPVAPEERDSLRRRLGLEGRCIVGSATRVATEKGIEYLLQAIPLIERDVPNIYLLHAGENKNVIGEEEYLRRIEPLVESFKSQATFLGVLPPDKMSEFFSSIDVLVVSSVNSTESFGLVQVEAMLCGTPVVATNLPGVRATVQMTGMGEIVPTRDSPALADAVVRIIRNRETYVRPRDEVAAMFDLTRTLESYEELFREEMAGRGGQA
jgi:glycosyltransferase involved in cell wall biosynthesis